MARCALGYEQTLVSIQDVAEILASLESYKSTHRLEYYDPYQYQKNFHNALGFKTEKPARQKALMAANQIGKTTCGSMEVAMHATGMYPKWWTGTRFSYANEFLVASTTNETTRDRCQKDLFGDPLDEKQLGTGAVPLDKIGERIRKPGVPNAYDAVLVKHVSGGWSKIVFRAYEQGPKKFMGSRLTGGFWGDEEPPAEIWSQMVRGIFATDGIGILTFTPEEGVTEVVAGFMNDIQQGQALIRASWDDAPHMTPERRETALAGIPAHERDMRSKGEPMVGSGLVFAVPEDLIICDPFEIPQHWARINGLDFGWDHPAAVANIAVDRDKDCVYIYDGWRMSRALIPIHAQAIKTNGEWIPCAWPHDGLVHDKQSGKQIAELYRDCGVNMWPVQFTNPPPPGMEEGKGGNGVEAGIFEMLDMMMTGRFKVFSTVKPWFEEARMYHRKDGKIVAVRDDFISATRVGVMFRRHAQTKTVRQPRVYIAQGISNW
jgi:phage terminase large subunit-like protein